MKNVDEVIESLLECLEYAYKLKFEGEIEGQQDFVDSIRDTFR